MPCDLNQISLRVHIEVSVRGKCQCFFFVFFTHNYHKWDCVYFLTGVSSTYTVRIHSAAFQVLSCAAFFCPATLSPLVSRISLTSPHSLPFKWGGLPLKGWEGAHRVKPILTPLRLTLLILSRLLWKNPWEVPSDPADVERKEWVFFFFF